MIEKNIRSSSRLNNTIIINKDRLFLEQSVIDTLIKPALKITKHHSVLFKALDTAGYLYKTNGYQCPLEIMDKSGNSQLLRTYCFESKILSNANYKAIFAPLNQENESFLMDCRECIPEYFLPLAATTDGKVAGRILRKEDEENNHILITGVGGYGKSYALCRIASHLAELGHKVIAFDSTGSFTRARLEKMFSEDYINNHISFHNIATDKLPIDVFNINNDQMYIDTIAGILVAGTKDLPTLQLDKLKALLLELKYEESVITAHSIGSKLKRTQSVKPLRNHIASLLDAIDTFSSGILFHSWKEFFDKHNNFIIISAPVVFSTDRNPLFDVLLASLFNYQQNSIEQPVDFLVDELQKENLSSDSPLEQIIAVGRNYRISVIAATQHYKLSGRLKTIIGNIDTKIFLKPTTDSEAAVLKFLDIPSLKPEYLKGMNRGDCIISGKLYDQTLDSNRHGVVLGSILDYQLDSIQSEPNLQENR